MSFFYKHRETLLVMLLGFVIMTALNVMMLQWNPEVFTNNKYAAWSQFWNHGEMSGFDTYTYIVVASFRPVYVLARHPILAMMLWPLYELNDWLRGVTGMNCTIYIVAVLWTLLATTSWTLLYRILRRIIELTYGQALLLTLFFFSFSHVMIVTFFPDHMGFTLPLLLLAVYLAGKAIKRNCTMPLWQSLPLVFVATGVTTTNMIKVCFADLFTQWGRKPFIKICLHFLLYLIPLGLLFIAYSYQVDTTQKEEHEHMVKIIREKMKKDKKFAAEMNAAWKEQEIRQKAQIIDAPIVTNTEYHIDRLPSLVENIFGEGLLLHTDYTLKDSNRENRPVLVKYSHWWYYAVEALIVALLVIGVWCGQRERLMWVAMSMFLFDMLLHVGLNFASSDVYIMTAHWAFVIPIAVAYIFKALNNGGKDKCKTVAFFCLLSVLTAFLWWHNLSLTARYILG